MNWYPNRKPSEEISKTTGCLSFVSGLATSLMDSELLDDEEEKNKKAKAMAADRATHVDRTREMNKTDLVEDFCVASEEDRRASVESGNSSSLSVGAFEVKIDIESESITGFEILDPSCLLKQYTQEKKNLYLRFLYRFPKWVRHYEEYEILDYLD